MLKEVTYILGKDGGIQCTVVAKFLAKIEKGHVTVIYADHLNDKFNFNARSKQYKNEKISKHHIYIQSLKNKKVMKKRKRKELCILLVKFQ